MIKLRILRWGIILDYPGGSNVIGPGHSQRDWKMLPMLLSLKMEEEATSQRMQVASEAEKAREWILP